MKIIISIIIFSILIYLSFAGLQPKDRTIIKSPLPIPKVGMVCANPDRAKYIAEQMLDYYWVHTNFRGYTLYVGQYKDTPIFVGYIGLGSASAAFMTEEIISSGAQVIIRLGTNDYNTTISDVNKVYIVEKCYGLAGLMQDLGFPSEEWGKPFFADSDLVSQLEEVGRSIPEINVTTASGYNIDAFYAFLDPSNVAVDSDAVRRLEAKYENYGCTVRDMETCAVLMLGQIRKIKTASVLQAVVKNDPKKHEDMGTKGIPVVLEVLRIQHRQLTFGRKHN